MSLGYNTYNAHYGFKLHIDRNQAPGWIRLIISVSRAIRHVVDQLPVPQDAVDQRARKHFHAAAEIHLGETYLWQHED